MVTVKTDQFITTVFMIWCRSQKQRSTWITPAQGLAVIKRYIMIFLTNTLNCPIRAKSLFDKLFWLSVLSYMNTKLVLNIFIIVTPDTKYRYSLAMTICATQKGHNVHHAKICLQCYPKYKG
jgi:hypothetical protein